MRSSSKAGLFLIELIIVIAFFSFASAICMRLFVYSHIIGDKSENLNMALNASQSVAECFRTTGGDKEHILELLPGSAPNGDDQLIIIYDKQWQPSSDGDFLLLLQIEHNGPMATGNITVMDAAGDELHTLVVQYYNGTEAVA